MEQNVIYLDMTSLSTLKTSLLVSFFPKGLDFPDSFSLNVKTPKGSTKYSHFGKFTMVSETDISFYGINNPYKLDLKLFIETSVEKGETASSKYSFEGKIEYNDLRKMVSGEYIPM